MDTPFELVLIEECSQYLDEFKNIYTSGTKLPLRRGMTIQPTEHITKIKVNKNRQPSNTHPRIHQAADDWFYKKFGIRARSQTAFCTASKVITSDYGFPFLVFPAQDYQVIWSRKVQDLFMFLTERKIVKEITGVQYERNDALDMLADKNEITDKALYEGVSRLLEDCDYVLGHLDQALASKNEIMVYCDHYYIAASDDAEVLEFMKDYIKGNI